MNMFSMLAVCGADATLSGRGAAAATSTSCCCGVVLLSDAKLFSCIHAIWYEMLLVKLPAMCGPVELKQQGIRPAMS